MIVELNKFDNLKGILVIGSHIAEEYDEYVNAGIKNMIFFEPIYSTYQRLLNTLPNDEKIKAFNLALGSHTGQMKMYVETRNDGMSCSLLEPLKHLDMYPWITFDSFETVNVDKLDNISFDRNEFNIINLDVQGYELEVLKGAKETLKTIDIIFTEVNAIEMYKGCALVDDIDKYLLQFGFKRIIDSINVNGRWGDALYIK